MFESVDDEALNKWGMTLFAIGSGIFLIASIMMCIPLWKPQRD
jgi:hypothetical protein